MDYSPSFLTRLGGDAIAEVAEWLDSHALCTLVFCGDKVLNVKLARYVRTVRHESDVAMPNYTTLLGETYDDEDIRRFTWPFYIRHWTALKHLSVQPGRLFCFKNQYNPHSFNQKWLALATRVLESLPRSLETLHLVQWPLWLKNALRIVWKHHVEQLELTTSSLSSDEDCDASIRPSSNALPLCSHASGIIAALHHFYLPNLQHFSLTASGSFHTFESIHDIGSWMHGANRVPLTHLSLVDVILSNLNGTLCNVLGALPRTLIHLTLHVENRHHCDALTADVFKRRFTLEEADEFNRRQSRATSVLPPHLTYLDLRFQVSPYMPTALLANLSELHTFKLNIQESSIDYPRNALCLLLHLPASVHTLSITGFEAVDIQAGLSYIPDPHRGLRQLIVNQIDWMQFSPVHTSWICTVLSSPKFHQLETFHPYVESYEKIDEACATQIGESMKSMSHLRSISNNLVLPSILAHAYTSPSTCQWMSRFTSTAPLSVSQKNYKKNMSEKDTFVILNHAWFKVIPMHLVAKRLQLTDSINLLLKILNSSSHPNLREDYCVPNVVSIAETLCKSVKHLAMHVHEKYFDALQLWPCALESLTILYISISGWKVQSPETTIDWTLDNVRTLRVLVIETTVWISNLDEWMQSLPKSLEKLKVDTIRIIDNSPDAGEYPPSERPLDDDSRLTYIPPHLKSLRLNGNFFVDSTTFDAIPASLSKIHWDGMRGVRGGSSDLHRLPRCIRQLRLIVKSPCYSGDYKHCHDEVVRWHRNATHLESVNIEYCVDFGEVYRYEGCNRQ